MLTGIHPLLSPDLLHALASMGHGDEIAIVDANFPAAANARRLIEMPGASSPAMLAAMMLNFVRAIESFCRGTDGTGVGRHGNGTSRAACLL